MAPDTDSEIVSIGDDASMESDSDCTLMNFMWICLKITSLVGATVVPVAEHTTENVH